MDSTIEYLSAHPYFRDLHRPEMLRIAQRAVKQRFASGQILALEGDPCRAVHFVIEGKVRVLKISPEGREQVLTTLGIGDPIHLVPALDGGPLPATTQALTESTTIFFSQSDFLGVLKEHPSVCRHILSDLARRLRQFGALAADLSLRTVSQRLAKMLVERALAEGRHRATQREMAAELGTVREVVARSLARFEGRGWVRVGRGVIEIVDVKALREHALLDDG